MGEYAKADEYNCTVASGHKFMLIRDAILKLAIRINHPKMTAAIWQCAHCGKIKESM